MLARLCWISMQPPLSHLPRRGRRAIEAPEVSAAAPSSGPEACTKLLGDKAVEQACGARYRREVFDFGLGVAVHHMVSTLRTWGYDATRESCQERSIYLFITYYFLLTCLLITLT